MNQPRVEKLPTIYHPRSWARKAHNGFTRHNVLVVHRRGGKSVLCVNEIIDQGLRFDKLCPLTNRPLMNPQYAFVATTFGQVEKIAWTYFKQFLEHIPGVKFNEKKLRVTIPHPADRGVITIFLLSAENYEAHRGIYLDGYVLDEYADMHPDVRDKVLLPAIADRQGWEIIIGTPKGANALKKLYDLAVANPETWFACLLKASETGLIPQGELQMLKATMSDAAYQQEMECDWDIMPEGLYFAEAMKLAEDQGRITSVPYNPAYAVYTFWDLGVNDTTAIWFLQEVGRAIHVINYMEGHGKGLDFWAQEVIQMKYRYGAHYLPHDVASRELTTALPRIEFLQIQGLTNINVVPKPTNKEEGIQSVRQVLPICIFDRDKCDTGIKALSEYRKKYDSQKQQYLNTPVHNWASNGSDAFRQFAVSYQQGFGDNILHGHVDTSSMVENEWDLFKV